MSGGLDWIPVLSQVKSWVQLLNGDPEGARRTQDNFFKRCPVISQFRSATEAISGDCISAKETQEEFSRLTPVVSQCRSAVHAICQDIDGARDIQNKFWEEDRGTAISLATGSLLTVALPHTAPILLASGMSTIAIANEIRDSREKLKNQDEKTKKREIKKNLKEVENEKNILRKETSQNDLFFCVGRSWKRTRRRRRLSSSLDGRWSACDPAPPISDPPYDTVSSIL